MIHIGDCLDILPTLDAESVDSIVTDPPYGLSFMGKGWDHAVPGAAYWAEMLRVAKPGAHLLAFGGTRTFHRLAVAIEDAGWELRDTLGFAHQGLQLEPQADCPWLLAWVYGSGFPKNKDLGGGWGTALKPAWEPIIMARKPFKGSATDNVLRLGTGGINIAGCRIEGESPHKWDTPRGGLFSPSDGTTAEVKGAASGVGRWPANLVHDGSDSVVAQFPTEAGAAAPVLSRGGDKFRNSYGAFNGTPETGLSFQGDSGSAARFFYCAKASREDRNDGLEGMPLFSSGERAGGRTEGSAGITDGYAGTRADGENIHPTVKPTNLMRWLCRLATPPGGTVLDPFMGSGSTGRAASLEGFKFIGIERDPQYAAIARRRISVAPQGFSFGNVA